MKTSDFDKLLKTSAQTITRLAFENDQLLDQHLVQAKKLEEFERREALTRIAWEAADAGRIKTSSIRSWVEAKVRDGRDPDFYREVLLSGGPPEGAAPAKQVTSSQKEPSRERRSFVDHLREQSLA